MKSLFNRSLAVITLNTAFLFSNPIFADPPNLTLVKNELKEYHDSGLYEKELKHVIQKAEKYIDQQATINQKEGLHKKLAIVLDIDETSLSNYKYMIQRDFCGNRKQFHHDINAADSPAIKPTLSLYKNALNHGVKVFFITGRSQSVRNATEKNLIKIGYRDWSGLYLRPDNYAAKSVALFKSRIRQKITRKGYTIVASIGDQYSDLKGGYAQKVFKLPNPFYYLP